ncbi:MAG: hypothetical protein WBB28_07800 [Crinalium sp.]
MKNHTSFVTARNLITKATVLVMFAGLVTACNDQTAERPDVVVVSPSPVTTPVTPATPTTTTASPITTPSTTTTTTTTNEPITDVIVIVTEPQQQSLVNRRVQFTNVKVQNVNGDRTFWVGQSNNQRLLVVLDPALDKGRAEKRVDINSGQTLDITGVIKQMPTPQQAQQQWGLTAAESQALQNQRIYLQADQVNWKQT